LSVCGIFKEVLTITTGATVFGDELTPINVSGLMVTIASIAAYNYMKVYKMKEDAKKIAHEQVKGESLVLDVTERQDGVGRHSRDDAYRNSTGSLIENSLGNHVDSRDKIRKGGGVEEERSSPMKRPEDLE